MYHISDGCSDFMIGQIIIASPGGHFIATWTEVTFKSVPDEFVFAIGDARRPLGNISDFWSVLFAWEVACPAIVIPNLKPELEFGLGQGIQIGLIEWFLRFRLRITGAAANQHERHREKYRQHEIWNLSC